jgi:molybdate transport system substrate-binding protein
VRRTAVTVVSLGLSAALLAACGSSGSGGAGASASPPSSSAPAVTGSVTVFAASSLKEAFTTIGQQFEAANPGVKVTFSFAASSALATQIDSGAPADVFASASTATMQQVVDKGGASSPTNFVKNVMEIATPPSNPANVTSVNDLAKSSVKVALCQPQVPCGSTAQKVFTNAGITVTPVTQEPDVKSVLAKVTLGEVDAGMVYVTDVKAAGTAVKGVEIPPNVNASTTYPIAALTKATNAAGAAAFIAYVLSSQGQAVLTAAGFESP